MSVRAGVVGLGSMGLGMATSLVRANIETYGFDRAEEPITAFVEQGGKTGELSVIAPHLDVVVLVVVNAAQVEAILIGEDALLSKLTSGSVVIACPTVDPAFAKKMEAACENVGIHYLDAPISGGSIKSEKGELTILASGSRAAFQASEPVLEATAERVFRLGDEAGPGSAMKVINQLLAGVHIATAAEAITFGVSQGVEPSLIVDVISKCAGTSWMFENRGPHIVDGDYRPHSAVEIFVKDLGIVQEVAKNAGFTVPLTETALGEFKTAVEQGWGREDDAAVAKVYAKRSGLSLKNFE